MTNNDIVYYSVVFVLSHAVVNAERHTLLINVSDHHMDN